MSQLLKSAIVVELDPPEVEQADLRVEGGRIVARGADLEPQPGEVVIDLSNKLLMPGMVCAHTHLYSTLARGMPAPPRPPANFKEILQLVWWRLDKALDEETIYWSALAGALDAAKSGTTCLFDHHASPSHIKGSLQIVREAIERVGLRAVLCYEVTDRDGTQQRNDGVDENREFLHWCEANGNALFRGLVGAHASFTLSDDSLNRCAGLMGEYDAGLHIHVAEDKCDVEETLERYGTSILERLVKFNLLNSRTILAHGIHLSEKEIGMSREAGAWFAHNPRSNMNNQVGYAPVRQFGDRMVLGTDGIGADMFEEARFAFFKARESAAELSAESWLGIIANNQQLARQAFDIELGNCRVDSVADLVVLDYQPPTPLTSDNLACHFVFGLSSNSVESVMVNGEFIVKDRVLPIDEQEIYDRMRSAGSKLWEAMKKIG
jgi:putative selenium metabolism protein SsnA